jgi:hypothetical protein
MQSQTQTSLGARSAVIHAQLNVVVCSAFELITKTNEEKNNV